MHRASLLAEQLQKPLDSRGVIEQVKRLSAVAEGLVQGPLEAQQVLRHAEGQDR